MILNHQLYEKLLGKNKCLLYLVKGVKSDADMREQEARIKKLQKEAEGDDNTLTEITVTFGSNDSEDGEKWAE